ncbi:unnamed protein product [Caenorhabditis bovis]|uniref:Uncharacterized protein n=1 Tax=Caenorhabditis bovis TaxID=2654633 RepID=A0A8S1ENU0_9PELO|nr:unnamed protein product [Caenorhabditis bovis]
MPDNRLNVSGRSAIPADLWSRNHEYLFEEFDGDERIRYRLNVAIQRFASIVCEANASRERHVAYLRTLVGDITDVIGPKFSLHDLDWTDQFIENLFYFMNIEALIERLDISPTLWRKLAVIECTRKFAGTNLFIANFLMSESGGFLDEIQIDDEIEP